MEGSDGLLRGGDEIFLADRLVALHLAPLPHHLVQEQGHQQLHHHHHQHQHHWCWFRDTNTRLVTNTSTSTSTMVHQRRNWQLSATL